MEGSRAVSYEKVKLFLGRYPEFEKRPYGYLLLMSNPWVCLTVKDSGGMMSILI